MCLLTPTLADELGPHMRRHVEVDSLGQTIAPDEFFGTGDHGGRPPTAVAAADSAAVTAVGGRPTSSLDEDVPPAATPPDHPADHRSSASGSSGSSASFVQQQEVLLAETHKRRAEARAARFGEEDDGIAIPLDGERTVSAATLVINQNSGSSRPTDARELPPGAEGVSSRAASSSRGVGGAPAHRSDSKGDLADKTLQRQVPTSSPAFVEQDVEDPSPAAASSASSSLLETSTSSSSRVVPRPASEDHLMSSSSMPSSSSFLDETEVESLQQALLAHLHRNTTELLAKMPAEKQAILKDVVAESEGLEVTVRIDIAKVDAQ